MVRPIRPRITYDSDLVYLRRFKNALEKDTSAEMTPFKPLIAATMDLVIGVMFTYENPVSAWSIVDAHMKRLETAVSMADRNSTK